MVNIKFNQELFDKHIVEISPKIETAISNINRSVLADDSKKCLDYLSKEVIENLLKADTRVLKEHIAYFTKHYPSSIENDSELNTLLREEIFEKEYNNWGGRKKYGAYSFVETLDLKTCSYCNRNYTFVVNEADGKLRPEIDHFYPKSIYPFLAMSFYNLIPSCSICNHTKSNKVEENLENPYDIKENSYRFTYVPNSIEFSVVEKEKYNFDSFEIELKGNQSNIELFKLEQLYKQHKDIVLELLIKKAYYPQSYIEELGSFFSKDEVYRYLFSNYNQDEDLHKRPLSKLVRDISEELGLLK